MTPTKICLGIPCGERINSKFLIAYTGLLFNMPCTAHVVIREGVYVTENRHYIVEEAKKEQCSHLLLLDADMLFKPHCLKSLIAWDKDIVGATYNMRKFPPTSTVKFADKAGKLVAREKIPTEFFQCAAVGFGFTLINMRVFEKVPKPWFNIEHAKDGSLLTGDDVWFCRQASKAGYKIWADPTLDVKHVGDFAY